PFFRRAFLVQSYEALGGAFLPLAALNGEKQVRDFGIELGTAVFFDLAGDGVEGECPTIRAVGGHGVQSINQSEDAGTDRYLFPLELLGVTCAVEAFVVGQDDLGRTLEEF